MSPSEYFDAFVDTYRDTVVNLCREGDCFPMPAQVQYVDGSVDVLMLAVSPEQVGTWAHEKSLDPNVRRLCFGLDRYTRVGQGTTLPSVFTYAVVERQGPLHLGFVEYDGHGELRTHTLADGEFWHAVMCRQFGRLFARFRPYDLHLSRSDGAPPPGGDND